MKIGKINFKTKGEFVNKIDDNPPSRMSYKYWEAEEEIKKLKQRLNDLGYNSELTYLPSVAANLAVLNISNASVTPSNSSLLKLIELSREYLKLILENSIGRHGVKH